MLRYIIALFAPSEKKCVEMIRGYVKLEEQRKTLDEKSRVLGRRVGPNTMHTVIHNGYLRGFNYDRYYYNSIELKNYGKYKGEAPPTEDEEVAKLCREILDIHDQIANINIESCKKKIIKKAMRRLDSYHKGSRRINFFVDGKLYKLQVKGDFEDFFFMNRKWILDELSTPINCEKEEEKNG